MTLLSYTQICDLIEDGVVENARYENVNSASLDLTLGPKILIETHPSYDSGYKQNILSLKNRDPLTTIQWDLAKQGPFVLQPGQFILAHTAEIFHLPSDISSEYKLKSSMARIGLEHLKAGWCDSGWHNSVLTLELRNLTTFHDIQLCLGDKIGQMIFFKHAPVPIDKSYAHKGAYNGDRTVSSAKEEKVK